MKTVSVQLTEPIEGHSDEKLTEIVLREPKYRDVVTLGEPSAYARSEGGLIYQAERDGVVQGYIERLLVEPKDPQLLTQLCLADTLKLKEAVFGFFAAAREAIST